MTSSRETGSLDGAGREEKIEVELMTVCVCMLTCRCGWACGRRPPPIM